MNALLHEQTLRQTQAVLKTRSGSFVFHGTRGVGKAFTARDLARQLNCLGDDPATCVPCIQIAADSYPDLITVRPEDKPSILIDQVRSLTQALSLTLYHPRGTRVVIIDDAQALTVDAQNALLKLIEEPPSRTIFILVTDQPGALLPTVRSRCAHIYFPLLSEDRITDMLVHNHNIKPNEAASLARVAEGAPGVAVMLATNPSEASTRLKLIELADGVLNQSVFSRLMLAKRFIDDKTDLSRFGLLLHHHLVTVLRDGSLETPSAASIGLEALERFRLKLRAKVAPRVALEQLMLEL